MSEKEYLPEFFRPIEKIRLFLTLHTCPKAGRFVSAVESTEDNALYLWGVMMATGLEIPGFHLETDMFEDAMQDDSAKSMKILAEAQDDVRRAHAEGEGITARAKNVASVLIAKLHLESSTGKLPKRKEVIALAARVHIEEFGIQTRIAADDIKEWLEVFEQAGLGYLPTGK